MDSTFYVVGLSSGASAHWVEPMEFIGPSDGYHLQTFSARYQEIEDCELTPGARIAPIHEAIAEQSKEERARTLLMFGRRYRDGTPAIPHLQQAPGGALRRWREDAGSDDGHIYDLARLVAELRACGAPELTREQIFAWEQNWRPGRLPHGGIGLVDGPRDLATLSALVKVTDLPDIAAVLATAAVGYQAIIESHFGTGVLDDEILEADHNREWLGVEDAVLTPPWWPMVTSVRPCNWVQTPSEPTKTLSDTYPADSLGPAVAALIETQRLVADNRPGGGALWVYVPQAVRASGWIWARHNRAGRWGMFCKDTGERAALVAKLSREYAAQHGVDGLVALVAKR